ncbi:farnesyl-diphosphate farnesyltransferase [Oceaniferula spumae]|uniref:Farnesyl-diphosphate farnesyltransferase n=1 Tax=Oceaniferula spumae TaxID=2979115 RepID=A0AAT9FGA6_9BACT
MNSLGKKILKDVSRSFYLSMRLLPKAMREPISLGYLLARASDTLADTTELDPELRADLLGGFQEVLHGADRAPWLERIQSEVIPKQQHEGEKCLLENLAGVFAWLDTLIADSGQPTEVEHYAAPGERLSLGARQHAAILTVMGHILRGQSLDIQRFELRNDFRFTLDSELEEYCYLVAGCVGEFWTEIGFISLGNFAKVEAGKLNRWGANYGKGLQLINILRDLPNDLKAGRCYLPSVDPSDHSALMNESDRWRQRARDYLKDGMAYADALTLRRTRMATALPGLIGERTLDLMDAADWSTLSAGVKVSRKEVYRCAWEAFCL